MYVQFPDFLKLAESSYDISYGVTVLCFDNQNAKTNRGAALRR
jgi:hypothetical protein